MFEDNVRATDNMTQVLMSGFDMKMAAMQSSLTQHLQTTEGEELRREERWVDKVAELEQRVRMAESGVIEERARS